MLKTSFYVAAVVVSVFAATRVFGQDAGPIEYAKVYSVSDVQVDFTASDGETPPSLVISAEGWVNSGGWGDAELAAYSYIVPPADGVLSFDFIAKVPSGIVTLGFVRIQAGVAGSVPHWLKGVRVHASTNEKVIMVDNPGADASAAAQSTMEMGTGNGAPVPWPFPWYTPGQEPPAQ